MNIGLKKLELIALKWVSMDYESLETINGNVSYDFGSDVSLEQLHNTLLHLRSKDLVESYVYSFQDQKYVVKVSIGQALQKDVWWYVTNKGEQLLSSIYAKDK